MNIAFAFGRIVAQPSVSMHDAARLDGLLQEGHEAISGCVGNTFHPNSADAGPVFLRSDCYQGLAFSLSPSDSLFQASQVRLVYFDPACQPVSARPEPSLAGTCATRSRPSCSCPAPTPAAVRGHWPRSSGSPASTWRETNPPAAYACPGRSCPPSPTFGDHTLGTA